MNTALTRSWNLLPVLAAIIVLVGFAQRPANRFDEITVERINVVEKDGTLRMVIANRERSPSPMEYGKPFGRGAGERPGIIFFNEEGTESGGLIFSGSTKDGKASSTGSLTFDQYNMDQALALQFVQTNGERRAGLAVTDYPLGLTTSEWLQRRDAIRAMPAGAEKQKAIAEFQKLLPMERLYVGRTTEGAATLSLADSAGRKRLRMLVQADGAARIEFLDEQGKVKRTLTGE